MYCLCNASKLFMGKGVCSNHFPDELKPEFEFDINVTTGRGLLKFVYFLDGSDGCAQQPRVAALEFLSVIIESWGRGGGGFYKFVACNMSTNMLINFFN